MSSHHHDEFHRQLDAAMPDLVRDNRIVLCEIGSTAHGVGDGSDDLDTMGVFIEPLDHVVGTKRMAHWVASTGSQDAQNTADDLDVTYYSLRKFAKLALAGNPTITNLFWAPVLETTPAGQMLRDNAHLFVSRRAAPRYMGYMKAQFERLQGTRGQKNVKRPELEAKYGFDTKYAYHVLRLGIQGRELLSGGSISMPMQSADRDYLVDVRTGKYTKDEVLKAIAESEAQLEAVAEAGDLPEHPDTDAVDAFLVEMHETHWARS